MVHYLLHSAAECYWLPCPVRILLLISSHYSGSVQICARAIESHLFGFIFVIIIIALKLFYKVLFKLFRFLMIIKGCFISSVIFSSQLSSYGLIPKLIETLAFVHNGESSTWVFECTWQRKSPFYNIGSLP